MKNQPPIPASVVAQQRGARRLLLDRCRELVREGVPITRRPRTLTPRTALLELVQLAERWQPRPPTKRKNEPDDPWALVLVEVAREAARIISKDVVLKTADSPVAGLLEEVLQRWSTLPLLREPGDRGRLETCATLLERSYLEDASRCLASLMRDEPHRSFAIEAVCVAAISELRSRGWSDAGLRTWFDTFELDEVDESLIQLLHNKKRTLRCFVPVSGWERERELSETHPMKIAASLGERMVDPSFPKGPYLTQQVHAYDEAEAAERAFLSARGVLDAVALVEPQLADTWSAPVVGVESGAHIQTHAVGLWRGSIEPLPLPVHALVEHDALGEACRYRVQAMQLRDPFTRLSLLWLGLERLVVGSSEYPDPPQTLHELVPKAMALHKIASEVEALARAFEVAELPDDVRQATDELIGHDGRVDRVKLLTVLQRATEEAAKQFRGQLAPVDMRLALWFERMRAHMSGPQPDRVAMFFDATRQRIEWQLRRLFRGHRRTGVDEWPLSWVHDLSLHAHHYLTAIVLAVMHDREAGAPRRRPIEVLSRRAAQYEVFLGLVKQGNKRALQSDALLQPLSLVGK